MARKDKKQRQRDRQQRLRNKREKRLQRRKHVVNHTQKTDDDLVFTEHSFPNVPRETIQQAILESSAEAASKIPVLKAEILNLAKTLSPTYFLANMTLVTMFTGMSDSGDISHSESGSEDPFQQRHIELAQGVFVTIPPEDFHDATCNFQSIAELAEKLHEISKCFQHSRYGVLKDAATNEQRHLLELQERIRRNTHGVRNWGYPRQVQEILRTLLTPLDPYCVRITGIRASDYVTIFEKMFQQNQREVNEHWQKFTKVRSKATFEPLIDEYLQQFGIPKGGNADPLHAEWMRQFGIPEGNSADLLHYARSQGWNLATLKLHLLNHAILHVLPAFQFSSEQLANWIGSTEADVVKAMDFVSLKVGDEADFKFENLFLGNPMWERPVLREGSGKYFCFLAQLFFSSAFRIFDRILSSDPKADKAHSQRRSQFLQSEVEASLKDAFGEQSAFPGEKWTLDGVGYETDLLIRVDTHLFIIELKSNKISWPALRGAPERLKRHINELLVEPAEQSHRLEAALRRKLNGEEVNLNISPDVLRGGINEITRLSITLEDFAAIQSNLKEIRACGFELNGTLPVTMTLADLQTILTILDNPTERLFYLHRRQRIQETVDYLADEIDLLGVYLETGFDLGALEKGEESFIALGRSKKIDTYFMVRDQSLKNFNPSPPRRKMSKWFNAIIARLTERKFPRWTEAALLLLSFSIEDQKKFEKRYLQMRKKLLNLPRGATDRRSRLNSMILLPPEWRDAGFACVALFEFEVGDRHKIMESAASNVFKHSDAARCLVLVRDIKDVHYPVAVMAMFDRPKEDLISDVPDA